jgi:predicted hydrocarbon binding protein
MARSAFQIYAIGENVESLAGEEVGKKVMEGSELITASSSPEKVARWVKGAMERLDILVNEETRNQVMLNCGYNCARANRSPTEKAKARRKKFETLDEFLEVEQRNPPAGTRLTREGDTLYQFYTPRSFTRPMRCYCSLLRGLPDSETASLTYCQCSRGFVQRYWESILERPVQVELLESCVSGAQECKFLVHL